MASRTRKIYFSCSQCKSILAGVDTPQVKLSCCLLQVTLIENLETYGIDPEEFGHRVQIGVACSTSLSPLPGKGKGLQLLIQGNQINFVADLLLGTFSCCIETTCAQMSILPSGGGGVTFAKNKRGYSRVLFGLVW